MSNNFNEITCVKALQQECDGLLSQVEFHQKQIVELREKLAQAKKEALESALDYFFFQDGEFMSAPIEYEDLKAYVEYHGGKE